jgi:hypothetical protein
MKNARILAGVFSLVLLFLIAAVGFKGAHGSRSRR